MVSKAAERSSRQRQETRWWLIAVMRWSCKDKRVVDERYSFRRDLTMRSVILEIKKRFDIGR